MRSAVLKSICFGIVSLVLVSGSVSVASGRSLGVDPLVSHLVGEWQGEGTYDGNTLALSRAWTLLAEFTFKKE